MQNHIIKRQRIELTVANPATAPEIQDEISRIYRQRIVPLIDQYCTELSHPDRIHRIDSLEIDLGTLERDALEEQFVEKVKALLRKALAAQINEQEESAANTLADGPKTRSALELFTLFAQTGNLPWWADHQAHGLLAENLHQLINESPAAFAALLTQLLRDASIRQRLASQYTDVELAQICGLLVPALRENFLAETLALIASLKTNNIRQSVWRNSLQVAARGGREHITLATFHQAVLERVSPLMQRLKQLQAESDSALAGAWATLQTAHLADAERQQLHKAIQTGTPRIAAVRALRMLKVTAHAELTRSFDSALAASAPAESELTALLRQLQTRGGVLAESWSALRGMLWRLPLTAQTRWLTALQAAGSVPTAADILTLLRQPASEHGLRPEEHAHLLHLLHAEPAPALDMHFSAAEEVTVTNAGLVILWPFLTGFFDHLGLLEERDFKDLPSRERAVGLLQVLATGSADLPEYLLPLNKLLCGLDVTHPFDLGLPLRKREAKECNTLLKAVIAQAPILNNMSVDGFRASFLLRNGMLTAQSGHWLLRVEHQTFDIVLSRLPWNWEWIKLPYMQAPLRVEWTT